MAEMNDFGPEGARRLAAELAAEERTAMKQAVIEELLGDAVREGAFKLIFAWMPGQPRMRSWAVGPPASTVEVLQFIARARTTWMHLEWLTLTDVVKQEKIPLESCMRILNQMTKIAMSHTDLIKGISLLREVPKPKSGA